MHGHCVSESQPFVDTTCVHKGTVPDIAKRHLGFGQRYHANCKNSTKIGFVPITSTQVAADRNLRGKTSAVGDFLEAIRHIRQNCV